MADQKSLTASGIDGQLRQIEMNVQIIAALVKGLASHEAPGAVEAHVTHIVTQIQCNLDHLDDRVKDIRMLRIEKS